MNETEWICSRCELLRVPGGKDCPIHGTEGKHDWIELDGNLGSLQENDLSL